MIRNIITAAILFSALISIASIMQLANAVEPELNLEVSAFKDNLATSNYSQTHPFAWTPDLSQRDKVINLYERLVLPESSSPSEFVGEEIEESSQRLFSFEFYQGDGLDDLRQQSKHHNRITLPDEDPEAYGVSVKQRF